MTEAPQVRKLEFADTFLIVAGVVTFLLIILLLAFDRIPQTNMQLFTVVVSFVAGSWVGAVINNRFGSSKGSDAKTDVINSIAQKAAE